MPILLKVKFGDDTRRLTLEKAPSYGELLELLKTLYVNLPSPFLVKYIDEDEDQVTIASDLELSEAIRVSGGSTLRLFLNATTPLTTSLNTPQSSTQSLSDLLKAFSPPTAPQPNADMPDLVNLFQNMGLNTSMPATNDPEQLRSHMKTLFQQLLSSPLIFNLLPILMPYLPQINAFLSSFESAIKKEPESKEAEEKTNVNNNNTAVHEGVTCDSCNGAIYGNRYKCSVCWNFDLCETCEKLGSHDKTHILFKIKSPIQHSFGRGCPYNRQQSHHPRWKHRFGNNSQKKPLSRYISDVTIPDGSKVEQGANFVKIWRLRNEGQDSWPVGTVLEHVGGDVLSSSTKVPVTTSVEPGMEVDIAVDMIAPEAAGRYVSFWKLSDADGVRFGQRVWADICVLPRENGKTEELESSVVSLPSIDNSAMETSLDNVELEGKVKQLADMGFSDLELNRNVLEKHNLDMVKTVQELLKY